MHARLRRCRDDARREQGGFTLVETMISVWILGAIVVTMMLALITMGRTSDIARRRTLAESELRRFADLWRLTKYEPCANSAVTGFNNYNFPQYENAAGDVTTLANPSTITPATATIKASISWPGAFKPVAFWDGTNFVSYGSFNFYGNRCQTTPGGTTDLGAQATKLTVTVSDPNNSGTVISVSETITKTDESLHP